MDAYVLQLREVARSQLMQIITLLRTSMELDSFTVPGCLAYGIHSMAYTGNVPSHTGHIKN